MRRLKSWIDAFITHSADTEAPVIFRRWTAISAIAAVLEQKVWVTTYAPLYPNLYTFLIAPPGGGKSQSMSKARALLDALPEPNKPKIAPTSVNASTLVDFMNESRQIIIRPPWGAIEYNAMMIMVGEFGTFMSKYENDLIAQLTDFYDVTAYGQWRRGERLRIKIERPLLNMLIGSTPDNLMQFMPEGAWGQGFTSRIMFIYSTEKGFVDDFAARDALDPSDLIHDLTIIKDLVGQFRVSQEYADAVSNWRQLGEEPKPTHPRLAHYMSRRKTHLYRLSMIAAIDRSNTLILEKADFNTAMGWLIEAEAQMPAIFAGPAADSDTGAMEEIHHFVMDYNIGKEKAMSEHKLIDFARRRMPGHAVLRCLDLMIHSQMLVVVTTGKDGIRYFAARDPKLSGDFGASLPDDRPLLN